MGKSKLFILTITLIFIEQIIFVSGYTYSGTIYENGDQYWNSNELQFMKYEIDSGETLQLTFSSSGSLEVMLCKCSDTEDIDNILVDLIDHGSSSNLYLWIDSYSVTEGDYKANSRMTANIAIFTVYSFNPSSMSFTLQSNLPRGSRFDSGSNSGSGNGFLILLVIVVIVAFLVYRNKNKNKNQQRYPYGVNRSMYGNGYNPNVSSGFTAQTQNPYSQPNITTSWEKPRTNQFCPNCGKSNTGTFCTDCGSKI